MRLKLTCVITLLLLHCFSSAQEICNNGIDDDGDGLIDCYDTDCAGQVSCADFFYGSTADNCRLIPPVGPFGVQLAWQSSISTSTRTIVLVADIDADGMPEVIAHDKGVNQLYILNGATGTVKLTINCPAINDLANSLAVADTDKDGFAEIYAVTNTGFLYCFEHTGAAKTGFTPAYVNSTNGEAVPGIADFDGDGVPEIYLGSSIFHSLTGAVVATGSGSKGYNVGNPANSAFLSVAADVLPDNFCVDCSGLELVCGNTVYAVNVSGATITAQPNALSFADGYTAVADMDMDGKLDVIVTSAGKVYVWNPRTGLQMGNTFTLPNSTTVGGRPNIADYDNDGKPEIGVGARHRYVAIDYNSATSTLSQLWVRSIDDPSEETTGTAFDFEGDGFTEVVYRDEDSLFVFDGATGATKLAAQCGSATRTEFPTIADVDADGQADIICNCSAIGGNFFGNTGNVRVFKSNNDRWIASRKVMNQHGYNVTCINDNLSVPIQQQNNAEQAKLNNFLCQSPIYTSSWQPIFVPVPDLTVVIDTFLPCRPMDSLTVTLSVCNKGSVKLNEPAPVTFYNGNPRTGGSKIITRTFTSPVDTGSCAIQNFVLPWSNTPFNLYVAINDLGINPSAAPQLAFGECDSTNNTANRNITLVASKPLIIGLDSSYCLDSISIPLAGSPTGGTFSGEGVTGSTFNPKTAGLGQHTIKYFITSGCGMDTSVIVTVRTSPPANAGSDIFLCSGQSDTIGTTPVPGYTYLWAPSSGLSSTSASNPVVTLTNNTDSASLYTYILQVQQGTCTGYDSIEVTVFPTLHVSAGADQSACQADSAITITGATPAGGKWSGKGITDSITGVFNPVIAGNGSHLLYYTYTNTASGCTSVDTLVFTVNKLINIDAGSNQDICRGSAANLQANGGNTYLWSPVTGLSNPSISNPVATPDTTTTYRVRISVEGNCSAEDSVTVHVFDRPVAGFYTRNFCGGVTIIDTAAPAGSLQYHWNMGNGTLIDSSITSYQYNTNGNFEITQIVSLGACPDTVRKTVRIFTYPDVDFTTDPTTAPVDPPTPIHFHNTTTGATQYQWFFTDGDSSIEVSPSHIYADTGLYGATLIATSSDGCIDSLSLGSYIRIYAPVYTSLYIPSAFSPNGDGQNDLFAIHGQGISKVHYNIFNRWGEVVFDSANMLPGWDGFYKGIPVPAGVYVYEIAVTFDTNETRKMIGSVTVVR